MERNIKDIISTLKENETLNSFEYARSTEQDHQVIVGQLKSLQGLEHVVLEQKSQQEWTLTSEGKECVLNGTPEYRIFKDVEPEGTLKTELEKKYGKPFQFGFQHCMKRKWLEFNKATGKIQKIVNEVKDLDGELLKQIAAGTELSVADYEGLKKRNLVDKTIVNYFIATKGPKFGEEIKEEFADLTSDMLKNKLYETLQFKPFNINSLGKDIESGSLHPLMKTRTTFREILLELGFEEMPTNTFVESSFWNFDTLFVPQQHPARDQQDTFFVKEPATSKIVDPEYWAKVKEVHETGGYQSIGWRYNFSTEESQRNIFRTHTTATSSKMLYKMAKDGFKDAKYFSIDRVFRNETLDATHLAEFHQIEGLVCGRDLGLQNLMGIIREFFRKIGRQT